MGLNNLKEFHIRIFGVNASEKSETVQRLEISFACAAELVGNNLLSFSYLKDIFTPQVKALLEKGGRLMVRYLRTSDVLPSEPISFG